MTATQFRRLSPSTRDLIRQLNPGPAFPWWGGNDNVEVVLEQIDKASEPLAVSYLMSLGLARGAKIRSKARSTIHSLFARVPFEALPFFDEALRRSPEYGFGGGDWYRMKPDAVRTIGTATDSDRLYLALMTCHQNGYVREMALRILGADSSDIIIPFALVRLADWVTKVADVAAFEISKRLNTVHADKFVDCLGLIDRLKNNSRFRSEHSDQVYDLLRLPECAGSLRRGINLPSRDTRRHCFRIALENPALPDEQIIQEAIRSEDVVIRKWAFAVSTTLFTGEDTKQLMRRAAVDTYGPIRRIAFQQATAGQSPVSFADLAPFLLDRSHAIRRECQKLISQRLGKPTAEFYRSMLQPAAAGKLDIGVLGLAETGTQEDKEAIVGMLTSQPAHVRRAAVRGLRILGIDGQEAILLQAISSDVPSVVREAASALLGERKVEAATVWEVTLQNPDDRVRPVVLKLFRNTSKWQQLQLYLQAAGSTDPKLSECSIELLAHWVSKFNNTFVQPTPADIAAALQLVEASAGRLSESLVRELRLILRPY